MEVFGASSGKVVEMARLPSFPQAVADVMRQHDSDGKRLFRKLPQNNEALAVMPAPSAATAGSVR